MALEILPYSAERHNAPPGIDESGQRFAELNAAAVLDTIGRLFVKHQVEQTFGLALVHQHFDLESDEKLLNVGNVAVPCKANDGLDEDQINPSAWAVADGGVSPYEFTYGGTKVPLDAHTEFLAELSSAIKGHGLSENLGLCTLDEVGACDQPSMEFTSGRANMTTPFDLNPSEGGAVDAAWQVKRGSQGDERRPGRAAVAYQQDAGEIPGVVTFAQCKKRCKTGPNTGHNGVHKNTRS